MRIHQTGVICALLFASCTAESEPTQSAVTQAPTASSAAVSQVQRLQSPDGRIELTVSVDDGQAFYSAKFDGEDVIGESRMGLRFADQHALESGLSITRAETNRADQEWEQPWGENRIVRDHHNELLLTLTGARDEMVHLRFRAFNDGVGFRYEVPEQAGYNDLVLTDEKTQFLVPQDVTAWWIPAREWNRYEYLYTESDISEMKMVHTPVTFRTPSGTHFSIHEAALVDYSGMSLERQRDGAFEANLAPSPLGGKAHLKAPFHTPWRTIQIADDASGLINSSLILNLNEPNQLGDVSWVEPAKYVGIWWAMHIRDRSWGNDTIHGATTEETIRYMDFAKLHGFAGVLVEGWNLGWDGDWYLNGDLFSFTESYPDFDLKEIAAHTDKTGVRLIGHHETSGSITNYENQMADSFELLAEHGVRHIKSGYVADGGDLKWIDEDGIERHGFHDGQYSVNHHIRVLKEAAKHKISINTHEPVKDTGLRRTYPNWISREGARGSEYDAWGVPPNTPDHTAIIPYTRMLSGPMDYTPGIFELRPNELPPVRQDMPRSDPPVGLKPP